MDVQACWVIGERQAELRTHRIAAPTSEEVLIQTQYSAISRGTERLVFSGGVPLSEQARMRAPFQEGDFPFPVKYGYINVGRVLEGPAPLLGKTVFSLFPHQTRFVAPISAVCEVPIEVPAERAVLAAGMETALNALWDGEAKAGDRIVVVGGGVIGTLCAYLAAQLPGTTVQLVDVQPNRAELAASLGLCFALPEAALEGADLVFHASGSGLGLASAIASAGREAKIVELSWYGERAISLELGAAFHSQRLKLCSSQVGSVPASQAARWSYRRRLACALGLLADSRLDALISGESDFSELPETLRRVCDDSRELCHRIRYSQNQAAK